jgi:hypothetical protein
MSFPSNFMAKSGPEPVKVELWSVTPFMRVSLEDGSRFVIFVVIFVSPLSRVDAQKTPSNFSPDVVKTEI